MAIGDVCFERPACIPANAPYIILPSGLACWREGDGKYAWIENRVSDRGPFCVARSQTYADWMSLPPQADYVTPADFHAARVFMGWTPHPNSPEIPDGSTSSS